MDPKEKQQPVTYVSGLGYLPATPKLPERRNLTLRYHLVILSTMLVLGLWLGVPALIANVTTPL